MTEDVQKRADVIQMSAEQGLLLYNTYNEALRDPDLPEVGRANLVRERDKMALLLDYIDVEYPEKV